MMRVRPVRREDYAAMAELVVRNTGLSGDVERTERRLARVLDGHPWRDEAVTSLIAEDETGKALAFLAVMPRPMRLGGRGVCAAVAGPLVIHPDCRQFAGTRLLRHFLHGPQDLSLMDGAGCATRAVWERLGGAAAVLYTLSWTRPLRPAAWVLRRLSPHLGSAARMGGPLARVADGLLSRAPGNPFRRPPTAPIREVDADALAAAVERVAHRWLHASHEPGALVWLLEHAAERAGGPLRAFIVGPPEAPSGYAVMSAPRGGVAQVVQMAAVSGDAADGVVRGIIAHAAEAGCLAITGRVDARCLNDLTDRGALLHASGTQMLVHSRDAALVRHIERGDAVLGRLDGAWWLGL
jgi:hypothetical protein